MRKLHLILCAVLCSLSISSFAQKYEPTKEIIEAREQFQDNKFGIFIHWGVYSMLAQGEWCMTNQNINYKEYAKLASGFYPHKFSAKEWVAAIKSSGAKYICITSRHHDGFSMFDTDATDYNIVDATPFGRDILKELAEECEQQGIKLHFYYSLIDWYRDDYQPLGRTGLGTGRPCEGSWSTYFSFMCQQLTELLTNYGSVGAIWLDGHWDQDQNPSFDWEYDKMYPLIHRLQPSCLIGNNHHIDPIEGEDIQIFERDVPGENSAGWHEGAVSALPLETCQTMNGMWGYKIRDIDYKSSSELIKYLVSTAGRNANLLLNVGPQPNGELPEYAISRMQEMGEWLSQYGETIYGTRSTLIEPQSWGVATNKEGKIWLHVMPEMLNENSCAYYSSEECKIFVPYTATKVKSVSQYKDKKKLHYKQNSEGLIITLAQQNMKDEIDYVLELELK